MCNYLGSCTRAFDLIYNWVYETCQTTPLEFELAHPQREEETESTLGWLLHTSRNDIIYAMKKYANNQTWAQMLNRRTKAFSVHTIRPWSYGIKADDNNASYDSQQHDGISDNENDNSSLNEMSPFFVALNLNQFDLALILVPEKFSLNTCEYCLVLDKLKIGVNPLTLDSAENKAKIRLMQEWLDQSDQGLASSDFPFIQLLILLPKIATNLVRATETSQDEVFAYEILIGEQEKAKQAEEFFSKNPVYQLLLEQAARDACAFDIMAKIGVFGDRTNQALSDVMKIKLNGTYQSLEDFLCHLILITGCKICLNPVSEKALAKSNMRKPLASLAELEGCYYSESAIKLMLLQHTASIVKPSAGSEGISILLGIEEDGEISNDQIQECVQDYLIKRLIYSSGNIRSICRRLESMVQKFTFATHESVILKAAIIYLRDLVAKSIVIFKNSDVSYNLKCFTWQEIKAKLAQASSEVTLTLPANTVPFAALWFGLLEARKDIGPFNSADIASAVQDIAFSSIQDAQVVARQMLDYAKVTSRISNGKLFLCECEWSAQDMQLFSENEIAFNFWLRMEMFKDHKEEVLQIVMAELEEFGSPRLSHYLLIANSLALIVNEDGKLLEKFKTLVKKCLNRLGLELVLDSLAVQTFTEYAQVLSKTVQLVKQFEGKIQNKSCLCGRQPMIIQNKKLKLQLADADTISDELFWITEEESKEAPLPILVLTLCQEIFTDEQVFDKVINIQKQEQANHLAAKLIEDLNVYHKEQRLNQKQCIQFRSLQFSGQCPIDFSGPLKVNLQKEKMHASLFFSSLLFDLKILVYLANCDLIIKFAVDSDRSAAFLKTFKDYCEKPNQLEVIVYFENDNFQICFESYLPSLHLALQKAHSAFLGRLRPGQPDVTVVIDYAGLAARMPPVKNGLEMFKTLKQAYSDEEIHRQVRYVYDEIRNKMISVQGCFASKFKSVVYNQLKGVLIRFDLPTQGNMGLDLVTIDEDILEKGSQGFQDIVGLFPEEVSPFIEWERGPKNYQSKIAILTCRF